MLNESVFLWRCGNPYVDAASTHEEVKDTILVLSVVFDLIPCLICSLFANHVYRGVDVSHPVYAVVFSNIILSILLSVFAFVVKAINNQFISCIGGFLALIIQSCLVYMNGICWSVVAILRYYLLIQVKGKNDENDEHVDMTKLKWIALTFYWGLTLVHCALRCCFLLAQHSDWMPNIARIPWGVLLYIANPITTCAVYYRLDIALKMRKNNADGMNRKEEVPIDIVNQAFCDTSVKMEAPRSVGTVNGSSVNTIKSNASTSWISKSNASTEYINDLPYGGIYVGAPERTHLECSYERIGLKKKSSGKNEEVKVAKNKQSNCHPYDTYQDQTPSVPRLTADDGRRSISSATCTKKIPNSSKFEAPYDFILPNEVIGNDQKVYDPIPETTDKMHVSEIAIHHLKRNKTVLNKSTKHPNARNDQRLKTETSNRSNRAPDIFVVKRYLEDVENLSNSIEGENVNNQFPQQDHDSETDEYKCSKEHKSILKALLVNCIIHGSIVIIFVLSKIKSGEKTEGYIIIVVALMLSLYRSFVSVLSAIFCFEVIYFSFLQFLETTQDRLRMVFDRLKNLI